jgi:hypothetical protein
MQRTQLIYRIIWPERRTVSADKIETWYSDALANNEIAEAYKAAKTADDMAAALHDAGIITLSR